MDCPVCRNAMITFELEGVEIDYCTDCSGIWLDAGELELLLGDSHQAKQLLDSFEADRESAEKPRKCPICRKRMQKIAIGQCKSRFLIDKCRRDHGLWFDKNELHDIFDLVCLDKENKIQKLLTNMFGSNQNTNMQ